MKKLIFLAFLWGVPLFAQQQIPIVGGVVTADMSSGVTSFKINLNQNVSSVVLTGQRPGSGGNTVICTLFFVQDNTGGWTVTFGGNINGSFPVNSVPGSTTIEQFAFDFSSNMWYATNGSAAGVSGISGNGTPDFFAQFLTSTSIGNAPMSVASGVTLSSNPFSQPSSLYPCVNSASGTTNDLLVTTDSNGNCINISNGQTINIIGIAYSGGGTSGTVQVCQIGSCPVILDNQSVIGDCVVPAATGAQGHDSGSSTCPSGVEQIGRVTSLNTGSGTVANVRVFISDVISQSQGQTQVIQINGATIAGTLANLNNTTPAAQTNFLNCFFQTDNSSPTSNISLECPQATSSQNGFVRLAGDLNGGTAAAPTVTGIQTIPVTFTSPAARDVICFPTTSTLANCPLGVPVRVVSGNSDTILAADRTSDVRYTAASGATAVTLPQAGTTGFASNITMILTNAQGTGTVTVTPTTSTINGASTLAITAGNYCFVYSDNTNYFANCSAAGGGGGTVTSFGAGNLSPLFTTSVATSTTTPVLSFSLSNAAAFTVFGNATSSSAAPGFTANPAVSSVILEGATSGSATVSASATGGTLNLGSTNATASSAGAIVATNLTSSALTSGNCVQASTGGILTTTAAACGTGSGGGQTMFPLENCTPDTSGLVFWTVAALTNWRDGHWEWSNTIASDTILYCKMRVPHSLPSGTAHILLSGLSANDGTASHTMTFKTGDSLISTTVNASACTYQATQNFTTTSTAYAPSTLVFGVNATLAADSLLIVCIDATTQSSLANNVMTEGLYLSFY